MTFRYYQNREREKVGDSDKCKVIK